METKNIFGPLSKALLSTIFVASGVNKAMQREMNSQYMASKNLPLIPWLLTGATAVELLAGGSLFTKRRSGLGAAVLAFYLIPTTLIFHDFWKKEGMERQMEMINFMKNLSIIGGLAYVAHKEFGERAIKYSHERRPETIDYIEVEEERAA